MRLLRLWRLLTALALSLLLVGLAACGGNKPAPEAGSGPDLGTVTLNAHPASLDGKTVVLRWNGKPNGDKFLTRVGERLSEQFPEVKLVKMWEVDESTAVSSDDAEVSAEIVGKIVAQNPDLVIAAQCD
jgi:ABC-type Fe3+-hydroxamate transport system substrate-binding protein